MYLQRNPTAGTKHYVYLNGASLLLSRLHAITGLIQRPFVLPIVANTTSIPSLSPFLFSLSRRHLSSPRHDIQAISTSLSRFSPVRYAHPRDTRALARKYRRTQEAIKSRNVFAWGRHVGAVRARRPRFRLMDRSGPGGARQ